MTSTAGILALLAGLVIAVALAAEPAPPAVPCVNSDKDRERIRAIALEGADEALKSHLQHLFDIWTKDESLEPRRAVNGFRIGVSAYTRSTAALMKWNPPICPEVHK